MMIITVKWEADKPAAGAHPLPGQLSGAAASGVSVELMNTQTGQGAQVSLRGGEAVEHRLRLEAAGVIELKLVGLAK